jgi:hypothetical protein
MKTPRELLLQRHAPANEKLDAIREEAVRVAADVNRRTAADREFTFAATILHALAVPFRELIWPARRIWAGLVTVWVALAIFNFAQAGGREIMVAKSSVPAAEVRLAFQEQRRLLAEILGPPPAPVPAEPRHRRPQPRSQRQTDWRISTVGDEVTSLECLWA